MSFARDFRISLRLLFRRDWFVSAVAVLSLALGIGMNTAVFTFVNAVLFPPLKVTAPQTLVGLFTQDSNNPGFLRTSLLNFKDYRDRNTVFSGMAAHAAIPVILGKGSTGRRALGEVVSWNYFSLLGIPMEQGRAFLEEEDRVPDARPVVVISHTLWKNDLRSDSSILGKEILIDGHVFTVIGVAPESFSGVTVGLTPELWIPTMMNRFVFSSYSDWLNDRRVLAFDVTARLRDGVSLGRAQAELSTIATELQREFPEPNRGRTARILPLQLARLNPNTRNAVVQVSSFLLIIVMLVLLIASVNVANLFLANAMGRQRDTAVRLALGASRFRLARQWLVESLTVSILGGASGCLVAFLLVRTFWSLRPRSSVPIDLNLVLDGRVLTFALLVSLATAIAVGVAPAFRSWVAPLDKLRTENVGAARGFSARGKSFFLVTQIAASLTVLTGAGLFIRSLQGAQTVNPGFNVQHTIVFSLDPGLQGYTQEQASNDYQQLVTALLSQPGVKGAALAQNQPLGGGTPRTIAIEGNELSSGGKGRLVATNVVTPGFFSTMEIAIRTGRDFSTRDDANSPAVAIVNETMAARSWPGQDAVGKRFKVWGQTALCTVVAVVADAKYDSLGEAPQPFIYLPFAQNYSPEMNVHVRVNGDPGTYSQTIRTVLAGVDSNLAVFDMAPVSQSLERSLWPTRVAVAFLSMLGLLALILTMVGIFGVMAYTVSQRTREIAIRLALGARKSRVWLNTFARGLVSVGIGLLVGLVLSVLLARALNRFLFGIGALDLVTFVSAIALIAGTAAVAIYSATRAVLQVDPARVLHQ